MARITKPQSRRSILERAKRIRLLLLDVDGVLTDGRIIYGSGGLELLHFHVRDGLALKIAQAAGITVALLSGRKSEALLRRAEELNLVEVRTGIEDKVAVYRQLLMRYNLDGAEVAYIGDDLPDLPLLTQVGKVITNVGNPSWGEGGGPRGSRMASEISGGLEPGVRTASITPQCEEGKPHAARAVSVYI